MALPALQQREAIVLGELKRRGYADPQIAAIMGSARQESAFNPWANESGGTGLGLFQWSYGRRAKVPKATGDYATDVARQIDLFESELSGPEKKAGSMLKSANDLSSAAAAMKQFERYGVPGKRYDYMNDYAKRLGAGQIQPITAASSAAASPQVDLLGGAEPPAAVAAAPAAKALNPIAAAALAGHNASTGLDDLAALRNGRLPDDPQRMVGAALAEALLPDQTPAVNSQLGDELVNVLATGGKGSGISDQVASRMGALGLVGRVADPRRDPLPSTGAHLDARVIKPDGTYVNPESARSILQNLHVGGKPLFSQQNGQWVAAAPITSRFGPRPAPTPGASSIHRGTDFGVAAGTELKWMGAGQLSHGDGYRSIKTPEGYEIRLLHTEPHA